MKTYFLDTNILLRFLLHDHPTQTASAEAFLTEAKEGTIRLILRSEVLMEIEHVLRSVYGLSRHDRFVHLFETVTSPYLEITERSLLTEALRLFERTSVDFVDCILVTAASQEGAEVLSFDKDFSKLTATQVPPPNKGEA